MASLVYVFNIYYNGQPIPNDVSLGLFIADSTGTEIGEEISFTRTGSCLETEIQVHEEPLYVFVLYNGGYYFYSTNKGNNTVELSAITPYYPVSTSPIDTVKLPDGGTHEINSYKTGAIPFGKVDSTSTATVYTATVPGVKRLENGTCVMLHNGVVTSAANFTININGLGAKPAYNNLTNATRDTTIFNVAYTMLFVYDESLNSGDGGWWCYRGYDSNTNTIGYQVRTNSYSLPMKSVTYRYRLLFTSADGNHFVPANNSTSTNATASRTVCQDKIDPFGAIVYYGTTASVAAGSRPGATALWNQYTLSLGYSFNRTGAALTMTSWKPVYVKCAPQTDGSAIIDSTTPYVQDLPSTEDGKIYIFLGVAYSATAIELLINHPVYYYKDGQIRLWTNATASAQIESITTSEIQQMWGIAIIITFMIEFDNGTIKTYQAEDGMTFAQWIESEYNTENWHVDGSFIMSGNGDELLADENDVIQDGYKYFAE